MRKFLTVTTFNKEGYESYGRRMIDSYAANWPADVELLVYAENCDVQNNYQNVIVKDLNQSSPELVAFKNKWGNVPKANGDVSKERQAVRKDSWKGFKWDAVRFSHKVYSIFAAAQQTDADVLIWMDADMYCHSPMTVQELDKIVNITKDLCYIGRERKWPECGLYSINLRSTGGQTFLQEFQNMYDDADNGIFLLDEWHDSFVFDAVLKKLDLKTLDWAQGLIKGEGHPLINSFWGRYLDHLKGGRKQQGKSRKTDLIKPRKEDYWSKI